LAQAPGIQYHQIFLDLSKAFDTIDRERLLSIMRVHRFGFRTMRFFRICWDDAFVAPQAGGVFGPQVLISAGVRQGNVANAVQSCGQRNPPA
jgi:hypothetical protein